MTAGGSSPRQGRVVAVPCGGNTPGLRGARRAALVPIALVLLALTGCLRDTCSGGQNMTDPQVTGTFDALAARPELTIRWQRGTAQGARLTDAYFADVVVAPDTDVAVADRITGVALTASRELTVGFMDLASYLATHDSVAFALEFPDRATALHCNHPGMQDRYRLEVTLHFDPSGAMVGSEMVQSVWYGPL